MWLGRLLLRHVHVAHIKATLRQKRKKKSDILSAINYLKNIDLANVSTDIWVEENKNYEYLLVILTNIAVIYIITMLIITQKFVFNIP